ncbi:hypothetical protein [Myroides odoratus]|jgi:Na+-transporting methylmalonyl-CoA/oxaloacetate decarboxylase beta subunit|uniref:Uncharacterized protein n=1 Tax=Myroides odoratus TaxID=256 RepID=A0A378RY65_MYROD|nr:hypothetical protein [Myroides odoratus]MDH6600183.1 Na+-transporting methylmalonyl-CoA/oxaloacetate decarboxylase beta subunit [Myroides gitamensis]EHQ40967.1 hypothetical protein Myrod_0123 [Myroides odoratus DSM 2801]EKB08401.1 hypothetical protein HMPREF9716_01220 [Myroides odoratus CIP 103059]MCS4238106.1 Na+-transporting methylmalonyl-CoA/oxaloacetate decarboxylase beta subunit [Myroides odoratus]QQU01913.1 hypothetical protein I6I88_09285 [Myroides odoratus]
MHRILAIIVILLGIYMIYLGIKASMQPPLITGIGFILIGVLFLMNKSKSQK